MDDIAMGGRPSPHSLPGTPDAAALLTVFFDLPRRDRYFSLALERVIAGR